MTLPHLGDEVLSAHLDGAFAHPHLGSCEACGRRLADLTAARDAVAAAEVAPLSDAEVDRMVARAVAAAGPAGVASADEDPHVASTAGVVSADPARLRRRLTPPPAWVLAAAAGIAALAGVAGLLQEVGTGDSSATLADGRVSLESSGQGAGDENFSGAATATGALDPEVVRADLGDQDDPVALAALLAGRHGSSSSQQDTTAAQARDSAGSSANPPSPTTTMAFAADRARCRAAAERIGVGRLGRMLSTSIVRWKSVSAEVLVFDLTEPSGGISRQAMVLARSDCALLADPRF